MVQTRREPASMRLDYRRAACACGRWAGSAPEFQVLTWSKASAIVMGNEFFNDETQVPLVDRNQVVEALRAGAYQQERPQYAFAFGARMVFRTRRPRTEGNRSPQSSTGFKFLVTD